MRALTLSLLLVGSSSFASNPVDPSGARDSEVLNGNVLVWHDSPLFTEPSETAQSIRFASFDVARKNRVGHAVPMRVVSAKGAFVEVELSDSMDCTWAKLGTTDDIARLKLFVKRSDLAPVLTKPYTKTFADGTTIALRPGMPVVPMADGWHSISLRGNELAAEIPAASVGHSYAIERAAKVSVMSGQEFTLAPNTTASLGGKAGSLAAWRATNVERRGDVTLFGIEDRCVAARFAVPTKTVREVDEDETSIGLGGGYGGGVLGLRNEHYLSVGTPLSVAGRQVAIAAKPIYLPAAPSGKTVCIDRRIWLETMVVPFQTKDIEDKLRLCAPTSRVVHEKLRTSASANGTTKR